MKEFKPSKDFVSKVMKSVEIYEETENLKFSWGEYIYSTPLRYAACAGGLFLGIINFIRICMAIFTPVVCR